MAIYIPIEIGMNIQSSKSDLLKLVWVGKELISYFSMQDEGNKCAEVRFEQVEIVRILDEMALSTEYEDDMNVGLIPEHFAYEVKDSSFWKQQSDAFKAVYCDTKHFRLITGWTCLDVISTSSPEFRSADSLNLSL
ncbi:hypothetical protein [Brucella haematophila]|nr:hypothetical protein [Brucella haematophila]